MTQFVVVRHGETIWNAERRIQGHLDSQLNEAGLVQAEVLGARLAKERFDAFYCSDLLRTRQTAEPYIRLTGTTPVLCEKLRERHLGVFQGLTVNECAAQFPDDYARFRSRDPYHRMPHGESIADVFDRTRIRFEALAAAHPGQSVLVVTHGGILDVLNRFVRGIPLAQSRDFTVHNSSINRIQFEAGLWTVRRWGDISHLTSTAAIDDF